MYQMLIVDDEIHAVKAVQAGVDWGALSITRIHVAYNIGQAKEIFLKHPIDMMVCDIEMPQGSGIDLLEWVKTHYPSTESIFLTCHSSFDYAKKAVQLGSLDYMLKPVKFRELHEVIQRGLDRLADKAQFARLLEQSRQHPRQAGGTDEPDQAGTNVKSSGAAGQTLETVYRFIARHIQHNISREDVARHVHLHPDYLSRLFKKETGKSIIEYILETKMELAKRLLSETNLSVSEIAARVGYSNFSYFARVFKSAVQMNPKQYRAQSRNSDSNRSE